MHSGPGSGCVPGQGLAFLSLVHGAIFLHLVPWLAEQEERLRQMVRSGSPVASGGSSAIFQYLVLPSAPPPGLVLLFT